MFCQNEKVPLALLLENRLCCVLGEPGFRDEIIEFICWGKVVFLFICSPWGFFWLLFFFLVKFNEPALCWWCSYWQHIIIGDRGDSHPSFVVPLSLSLLWQTFLCSVLLMCLFFLASFISPEKGRKMLPTPVGTASGTSLLGPSLLDGNSRDSFVSRSLADVAEVCNQIASSWFGFLF